MHARIILAAQLIAGIFGIFGLSACALNDQDQITRQTIRCANDFDFWLGDWAVSPRIHKSDGSWLDLPATTSVTRRDGSCVITEHWSGRMQFFWEGMPTPKEIWGSRCELVSAMDDGDSSVAFRIVRSPTSSITAEQVRR